MLQLRLTTGLGAIISMGQAVELLPVRRETARDWLREIGAAVNLSGSEVVCWKRVVESLDIGLVPVEKTPQRHPRRKPRPTGVLMKVIKP